MIKKENEEDNPQFIFLEKIKAMLITIIEKERITNSIKASLSYSPNLNIINYFNEIDSNKKNYIDIKDIKKYLKQNSISYDEHLIRKFIHFFDKHNKFNLICEDFSKIFVPYNVNDNNYNNYNTKTEKEMIINIIEGYLELAEQINEMIINIRNTNNFTTYESFMGITKGNKYLDEEFLSHFLEHNYKSEEIKNLIYLIDLNNDALISYEEFQDFFIPLLKYNEGIDLNKYIENDKIKINNENNDIVNFEKSGKFINNLNNDYFNQNNNVNLENKIDNNKYTLNENNIVNIDINNNENDIDNNEEQINNMENSNKSVNDLKNAEINENNTNNNKLNSSQKENENDDNNNNYGINMSNDDEYDNYCNFYRKTRQIISSSSENNKINQKQNLKDEENINDTNKSIENNQNNQNKELNIIHSEIQYITNNKNDKNSNEFTIVKNSDIILSEKVKNNINIFNTAEKESNLTNINNFTCGKNTKSSIGNSSSKKINLNNINSNDLENYSLSNEYNKINNNLISKDTIKNIKSNENILVISENKNETLKNSHINSNLVISNENNKIMNSDNEILNKEKEVNKQEQNNNQEKIITNISLLNFIKYIQYILEKEKNTLDLKDKLSLREDISLKDIFCIFDYNKKNKISKKEFKVVCKKIFGLYPTSDQINLVYKRYDNDKDDELNIKDFFNLIKPLKEEYSCFLFNKKKNEGNFNMKSKKMLNDVIRAIIEDEGYYYKFKDDLDNQNLFNLKDFWKTIEKYINKENFDKLEMHKFLNDFGCNLRQYDIDIIFNKIDHDKDDIISYDDLTQEFLDYY